MLTTHYKLVSRSIRYCVAAFSDHRLNDGGDVWWRERELELRCSVAATANAMAVKFAANDSAFDIAQFAAACGLYVSDGRDNYSNCHPGELTWERPHGADAIVVEPRVTVIEPCDRELQIDLPKYNGWRAAYEYPGYIHYSHPDGDVVVCATSDFNGDGKLDIQIQTAAGHSFDDGENNPWPHEGRTAEKMFARIRPYLDKYHPTAAASASKEP